MPHTAGGALYFDRPGLGQNEEAWDPDEQKYADAAYGAALLTSAFLKGKDRERALRIGRGVAVAAGGEDPHQKIETAIAWAKAVPWIVGGLVVIGVTWLVTRKGK